VLRRLFGYSPHLKQAYDLHQWLCAIFDQPLSQPKANKRLSAWIQRVRKTDLTCFDAFLKTLVNWWEAFTAFFVALANSDFF
jgi:transposase